MTACFFAKHSAQLAARLFAQRTRASTKRVPSAPRDAISTTFHRRQRTSGTRKTLKVPQSVIMHGSVATSNSTSPHIHLRLLMLLLLHTISASEELKAKLEFWRMTFVCQGHTLFIQTLKQNRSNTHTFVRIMRVGKIPAILDAHFAPVASCNVRFRSV